MTKGGLFRKEVEHRLCYAGRFQFERWVEEQHHFVGRFIGQVPSCEGHPNTKDLGEGSGSCYLQQRGIPARGGQDLLPDPHRRVEVRNDDRGSRP